MRLITRPVLIAFFLMTLTPAAYSLAGDNDPICLTLSPAGTQPIKVDLNHSCGSVSGTFTYRPDGKTEDQILKVSGLGQAVTHDQDSYCRIPLKNNGPEGVAATITLKLHATKDQGDVKYVKVDYDIDVFNINTGDDFTKSGSQDIQRCN